MLKKVLLWVEAAAFQEAVSPLEPKNQRENQNRLQENRNPGQVYYK
jgi:hypothetical protein